MNRLLYCVEEGGNINQERSMEEDAYMQLNHKDIKKWYGEHKEFKEKYILYSI